MPIRNNDYVKRTADEIREDSSEFLVSEEPRANPYASSTYTYALLYALSKTVAQNQEESLQNVYRAAYVEDASDEELTKKSRNLGVYRRQAVAATGLVEFTRSSPVSSDTTIKSGTLVETLDSDPISFETTEKVKFNGPATLTDTSEYSTTSTSYVAKTSHTFTVDYRDSIDVSADIKTDNSSYTVDIEIADTTNTNTITTTSTTNTSYTTVGPTSYDVSSVTGDITVEYRIRVENSNATGYLNDAQADVPGQMGVKANIVGVNPGSHTNVGAGAITTIPSPPIDMSVTNPEPTGDPTVTNTSGDPLRTGRDREGDDELRDRVLDRDASDEGPSSDGVKLALDDVDGVVSTDLNVNKSGSTVDGIDPYSAEVIVYGGDVYEIASTLHDTMSITTFLRLQGGVNGTKETTTVHDDLLDTDITTPITRPPIVTFELEVDVVHTSSYEGDVASKDAVVEYVGGTFLDDSTTVGLGIGEDVLINEIENQIVEVQGVTYADVTLLDTDGDGTDDTTTTANGVPILDVADGEVARVDADDITLSTTQTS